MIGFSIHPLEKCECARRRPTGRKYFTFQQCLCEGLIPRTVEEDRALRAARKDLEEREGLRTPTGLPEVDLAKAEEIVVRELMDDPTASNTYMRGRITDIGVGTFNDRDYGDMARDVRRRMGIVPARGGAHER